MCQAPILEKKRIRVTSSVAQAGLSDTITEESVSSDSSGQTPQGLAGWALIKRRLPTVKEQQNKPATTKSLHIFLHLPAVALTFLCPSWCSSLSLPRSLCVFLPWKRLASVCKHGGVSWESSLSLGKTAVDTFPSRRPVERQQCQAQSRFIVVVLALCPPLTSKVHLSQFFIFFSSLVAPDVIRLDGKTLYNPIYTQIPNRSKSIAFIWLWFVH